MNRKSFLKLLGVFGLTVTSVAAKQVDATKIKIPPLYKRESIPELYVEISPRGSGKTYRLLHAVNEWMNYSEDNVAWIRSPSPSHRLRGSSNFKKIITRPNQVHINEESPPKSNYIGRNFYDEFDYLNLEKSHPITNGYYCSSPAKIRRISELNEGDFLVRLLKASGGKCYSFVPIHLYDDMGLFKNTETNEAIKEYSNIRKEYCSIWLDV